MRTARTLEAEWMHVLEGSVGLGTKKDEFKYRARLGYWISPCYGPFLLGASFDTYEPFICLIFLLFRAAVNRGYWLSGYRCTTVYIYIYIYIFIYIYLTVKVFFKVQRRWLHLKHSTASKAYVIGKFKNFKQNLFKCNANIWFNKQSLGMDIILNYIDGEIHIAIATELRLSGALLPITLQVFVTWGRTTSPSTVFHSWQCLQLHIQTFYRLRCGAISCT
jgi:hypothetical protein